MLTATTSGRVSAPPSLGERLARRISEGVKLTATSYVRGTMIASMMTLRNMDIDVYVLKGIGVFREGIPIDVMVSPKETF